jgi:hypothetical protein
MHGADPHCDLLVDNGRGHPPLGELEISVTSSRLSETTLPVHVVILAANQRNLAADICHLTSNREMSDSVRQFQAGKFMQLSCSNRCPGSEIYLAPMQKMGLLEHTTTVRVMPAHSTRAWIQANLTPWLPHSLAPALQS